MERPNPYKIPAKIIVVEPDAEPPPPNHPENALFAFLGALSAAVVGLLLYQAEIRDQIRMNRSPAAVNVEIVVPTDEEWETTYEYIPSLYP